MTKRRDFLIEFEQMLSHTAMGERERRELASALSGLEDGELGSLIELLKEEPSRIYDLAVNLAKKKVALKAGDYKLWANVVEDEERRLAGLEESSYTK